MFRGDGCALFFSCCDEGAPGQMVGLSEEAAGSLMDGGDSSLVEEVFPYPGDGEVVPEVIAPCPDG